MAGLLDTGKRSKPGRLSAAAAAYTAHSKHFRSDFHSFREHLAATLVNRAMITQHSTQQTLQIRFSLFQGAFGGHLSQQGNDHTTQHTAHSKHFRSDFHSVHCLPSAPGQKYLGNILAPGLRGEGMNPNIIIIIVGTISGAALEHGAIWPPVQSDSPQHFCCTPLLLIIIIVIFIIHITLRWSIASKLPMIANLSYYFPEGGNFQLTKTWQTSLRLSANLFLLPDGIKCIIIITFTHLQMVSI